MTRPDEAITPSGRPLMSIIGLSRPVPVVRPHMHFVAGKNFACRYIPRGRLGQVLVTVKSGRDVQHGQTRFRTGGTFNTVGIGDRMTEHLIPRTNTQDPNRHAAHGQQYRYPNPGFLDPEDR